MKQELVQQLKDRYPLIFSEVGIECGDGWYTIIDYLCSNIQRHTDWWNTNRKERPIVEQVAVDQCKEKFGTLRFYYEGGDEYIKGLVSMAESMSEVTCEVCGNPGERRAGGWIKTLCDTHHGEREALIDENLRHELSNYTPEEFMERQFKSLDEIRSIVSVMGKRQNNNGTP